MGCKASIQTNINLNRMTSSLNSQHGSYRVSIINPQTCISRNTCNYQSCVCFFSSVDLAHGHLTIQSFGRFFSSMEYLFFPSLKSIKFHGIITIVYSLYPVKVPNFCEYSLRAPPLPPNLLILCQFIYFLFSYVPFKIISANMRRANQ